jgi:fatty-acyl-CoA synthase
MQKSSVNYGTLSPVKFLVRSTEVYPDKVAVVFGGNRRTYSEFYRRLVSQWRSGGDSPG